MTWSRSRLRAPSTMVAFLILLALALRIGPLGQSIWGDELFLYRIVNGHSVGTVLDMVGAEEKTPPLGFLLARLFSGVGDGTVWVRLPSLLAGLSTVGLIYLLGRRVAGTTAGLLAAAWIALSPFEIFYATESRAYALVQCFCVATTLALLVAIERRALKWWLLVALCGALAIYSHYIAVLVLGPQALWALWTVRRDRELLVRLVGAHLAMLALFLPWVPDFLEQAGNSNKEAGYVDDFAPNTWPIVRQLVTRAFAGHPFLGVSAVPGTLATILILVGLGVATLSGLRRALARRMRPTIASSRGLMGLLAITPLALLFAYSALPDTSFLLARNTSVLVPYGIVALSCLLLRVRPGLLAVGGSGLVLFGLALGAVAVLQPEQRKPDARAVAQYMDHRLSGGAVLINGSFVYSPEGPPSKAPLTYLKHHFVYAPGDPNDRSTYIYFSGKQVAAGYETARRQHRPVALMYPGGKKIRDFLSLPSIYQPFFRLTADYQTRGLAGGYGVRIWMPR